MWCYNHSIRCYNHRIRDGSGGTRTAGGEPKEGYGNYDLRSLRDLFRRRRPRGRRIEFAARRPSAPSSRSTGEINESVGGSSGTFFSTGSLRSVSGSFSIDFRSIFDPNRSQDSPRTAENGPRWPWMAPRRPKKAPRQPRDGPKWLQAAPRWPQDGSRRPQDGPRQAPNGPGGAQTTRWWPKWVPKRSQNGPRTVPKCVQKRLPKAAWNPRRF